MSLKKCKECGKDVSTKAAACPHCGAKQSKTRWGLLIGPIIGVWLLISFMPDDQHVTPKKTETPEQKASREAADLAVQRAAQVAKKLKAAMRDPESFNLESALVVEGSGAVCYEYRAKNGFGGTNVEKAVLVGELFKTSSMRGFAGLWNKECANKRGTDAAAAIRWLVL